MTGPDEFDVHLYDEDFDDEGDDVYPEECGLTADGSCMLAGTEWCDWDCPISHEAAHNCRRDRKARPAPLLDLMGTDA